MKKVLILFFALVLTLGIIPINQITQAKEFEKVDPALLELRQQGNPMVEILVKMDMHPIVKALTDTGKYQTNAHEIMSPSNKLSTMRLKSILNQQSSVKNPVKKILGFLPTSWYQYTVNGFYAKTSLDKAIKLSKIPGVSYIYNIPQNELHRIRTKKIISSEKVLNEVLDDKGKKVDGSGVLCSVTDTGLDYTHQDFGSQKSPAGKKVLISRDLAENDGDCQEVEKVTNHGTACAGIVAADGPGLEKGIAPKALLAGYKISGSDGGLDGDAILKSFEFCIKDKIQVSNNSYGAIYGSAEQGYASESINNAVDAGCVVVASQGNHGAPGYRLPYPSGSTAAPHNAIGVGATDDTDYSKLRIIDAQDQTLIGTNYGGLFGVTGKAFKHFDSPFEVVDCGWGRTEDFAGLDVKGKVALIQRGPSKDTESEFGAPLLWKDKNLNAAKLGAVMILVYNYDNTKLGTSFAGAEGSQLDPNLVPAFQIARREALAIRKQLHLGNDWKWGAVDTDQKKVVISVAPVQPRANLADFTSIGPTTDMMLKPDVCAPGVAIRSTSPFWEKEKYTDDFGGTSAAGPFVAGCSALIVQGRPEWKPLEIKRALMNTATLLRRTKDDRLVQLTAQGQGRVNVHEAITADVLVQPPSALIIAKTKTVRIADWPEEFTSTSLNSQLDQEIKDATIPLKFYNYNSSKTKELTLSFEINSRFEEDIKIAFTTTNISIPRAAKGKPSIAWVGVNIDFPSTIKGDLNDVVIYALDQATGKKIHMGVCIYSGNPRSNTFASAILVSPKSFTPNNDGEDETVRFDYTLTNGTFSDWMGYYISAYDNYAVTLAFWAVDQNQERWIKIYEEANVELGFHSFTWDGKDDNGNYVLPEGDWSIQVICLGQKLNMSARRWDPVEYGFNIYSAGFSITKSTVPPLPTLMAYALPIEPGVGQEFEVGLYIKYANNLKSIQFKLDFSAAKDVVKFLGADNGDFMSLNETNTLYNFDFDEEKNTLFVDIQRPLDGASGEGYLVKLRFLALEQNFFDIDFKGLQVTVIDTADMTGQEKTAKAFYKRSEIVIQKQSYERLDFNLDGYVDGKDLAMLSSKIGAKKGDGNYNWRCDLNYDSLIDFTDFAEFAKNYN